MEHNPRLKISAMNKSFSVPVLKELDLTVSVGSIHGIVGENGAGKSTLMNILSGLLQRDSGEIELDGMPYHADGVKQAMRTGVCMAAQELSIIENLTVCENILLKALPSKVGVIDLETISQQAADLIELIGLQGVKSGTLVSHLTLAQKQQVELAKVLATPSKLLILDEPTAALTSPQADRLHDIIKQRAQDGTSVIYISHRLEDVLNVCDEVSVLLDGVITLTRPASDFTVNDLIREMSNRDISDISIPEKIIIGDVKINVEGLTSRKLPNPISLECRTGEIVGIAGLAGSGRSELLAAIFGLDTLSGGTVCINGVMLKSSSPAQSVKAGMALLAEDRKTQGIFKGHSIALNMTLAGLDRISNHFGILNSKQEQSLVMRLIEKLGVKCEGARQHIDRLSGGNQQKIMLGRWLHNDADILLLDEPTRGVDVGAKYVIHDQLRDLCKNGSAIIMISSEIEELTELCDRIIVLSDKKLTGEFAKDFFSTEAILEAAFREYMGDRETGHSISLKAQV